MDGIIRKIKLAYAFVESGNTKNGGLQKASVFSVDDVNDKINGNKIHSIAETHDQNGREVYRIMVIKGDQVKLWKKITPENCTVEVEYFI